MPCETPPRGGGARPAGAGGVLLAGELACRVSPARDRVGTTPEGGAIIGWGGAAGAEAAAELRHAR
uniref:hypothetical protein n=1 Tax=Nocardia abscessus TaxID=120957 RepID=UPI003CC7E6B2